MFFDRLLLLTCSRLVFRTCEVACNHAARKSHSAIGLSDHERRYLGKLNRQRVPAQRELAEISGKHVEVCAECKGHCCGGVRERDAFIDRVVQDPETVHRGARRTVSSPSLHHDDKLMDLTANGAEPCPGHCTELTSQGCRIPYELRPIQCVVYFCSPAIWKLSAEDCRRATKAALELMSIQVRAVLAARKLRALRRRRA